MSDSSNWLTLNVGGVHFTTTRTTLTKEPDSFFSKLLVLQSNGLHVAFVVNAIVDYLNDSMKSQVDDRGAVLIDRDPHYFAPILNFLRHGKLVLDKHVAEEGEERHLSLHALMTMCVLEEAEFFGLNDLIALIKERMAQRDAVALQDGQPRVGHQRRSLQSNARDDDNVERVYRVLQCHEAEVTHLMSTLSDGWKFEQLVNVGHDNNYYDNNDRAEFLAIVSRECRGSNSVHGNHGVNGNSVHGNNLLANGNNAAKDRGKLLLDKGSRM